MIDFMVYVALIILLLEIFIRLIISYFRQDFQWLITKKDDDPIFDKNMGELV